MKLQNISEEDVVIRRDGVEDVVLPSGKNIDVPDSDGEMLLRVNTPKLMNWIDTEPSKEDTAIEREAKKVLKEVQKEETKEEKKARIAAEKEAKKEAKKKEKEAKKRNKK